MTHGRTLIVVLTAMAIGAACRKPPPPATAPKKYVHPNGLALALPEKFDGRVVLVDPTPTGFIVSLDSHPVRRATSVLVKYWARRTEPGGAWPETRTVRGATIHFARSSFPDASVGSGGPEYELRAWERARAGNVEYVQLAQTEGNPDFALLWAVVEGVTPPP